MDVQSITYNLSLWPVTGRRWNCLWPNKRNNSVPWDTIVLRLLLKTDKSWSSITQQIL